MHRVFLEQPIPEVGGHLTIDGEEASHALRVKRLQAGDVVRLLDGAGIIAEGRVDAIERVARASRRAEPALRVVITSRMEAPRPTPWLEVFTATPKGTRVDEMIDQLSQVGAASWAPLRTERGIVDPRPAKLDRLDRIAREAAKQCGRAWLMRVGPQRTLAQLLSDRGTMTIVADVSGAAYGAPASHAGPIRVLIGPEGGWTPDELDEARAAGATITSFGPHAMRIETAAVAGAAVIMSGSRSP